MNFSAFFEVLGESFVRVAHDGEDLALAVLAVVAQVVFHVCEVQRDVAFLALCQAFDQQVSVFQHAREQVHLDDRHGL